MSSARGVLINTLHSQGLRCSGARLTLATQQLSAMETDVAWQSMNPLIGEQIGSADSSVCYRSTVPLVGFADSPMCYRSHSAGDPLTMHEPVFLGLELGMPATEVKHRQLP